MHRIDGSGATIDGLFTEGAPCGSGIYAAATGISIYGSTTRMPVQSNGGGGAHNNMQPTAFLNAMIKL